MNYTVNTVNQVTPRTIFNVSRYTFDNHWVSFFGYGDPINPILLFPAHEVIAVEIIMDIPFNGTQGPVGPTGRRGPGGPTGSRGDEGNAAPQPIVQPSTTFAPSTLHANSDFVVQGHPSTIQLAQTNQIGGFTNNFAPHSLHGIDDPTSPF